jgi:hypothetical protein
MSNQITASMSKLDSMRFTPHIEVCIEIVDDASRGTSRPSTAANDVVLVSLCRLRGIVEKIRCSGLYDESVAVRGPTGLYVGLFRAELDRYWASLREELRNDRKFLFSPYFRRCLRYFGWAVLTYLIQQS